MIIAPVRLLSGALVVMMLIFSWNGRSLAAARPR
jgi:hypothetical protein